ncbi:Golgi-specific brefeldin A-resistance guanine nucleotide exchange factor 1 isoform X1 [Rhipicephalus sanguineus]|uniref:Golgi-specific brefeldin A-resistance guanine nucleotide exchange factor 1 isoform X1 n=1 Tax=Rhipicephalus sanguineus TaxID=34632 RepID=UPI001895AD8C|nr:Golgi-specific brefeldin A-resistance guanine nucleotide exchange factor 1 isoform X1 [Rhipicephalus sanguineus]XP_049273680.1 Golgi-specific brefeldin A-resistance guanine nucleotide exchange factor 1 isoform X1 [Rhipicephalus sanguineus]
MYVPENHIYIIAGEVAVITAALRRSNTGQSNQTEEHEALNRSFSNLKDALGRSTDISDIEPSVYFGPFLEAIRSDDTSGIVTGQALASVNKFLSYGLLDHRLESSASAAESIADAVTHARFMGIDPASDEVVLMKILLVLRSLLLSHVGALLSNESVCEMMQSCIRICFEPRLSELLRKSAEQALMDMVQLLFSRLPQFSEVAKGGCSKKLKMRASGMDNSRSARKRRSPVPKHRKIPREPDSQVQQQTPSFSQPVGNVASQQHIPASEEQQPTGEAAGSGKAPSPGIMPEPEVPAAPDSSLESGPLTGVIHLSDSVPSIVDLDPSQTDSSVCVQEGSEGTLSISQELAGSEYNLVSQETSSLETSIEKECSGTVVTMGGTGDNDYVNPHGVRFTALHGSREGAGPVVPYGLPCVWELLRFLASLLYVPEAVGHSQQHQQSLEMMIHSGLNLLAVALESGADHISSFPSLLGLVKDDVCRNLLMLLNSSRLSIFVSSLRVSFLLFEALRTHLKFQLEMYLTKLMDLILSESTTVSRDQKELSVEAVLQFWRIPGLITELYLNYDCDLFCSNLFEDLTKVLSKNAFPVAGLQPIHLLSLDALLAVIDSIETRCHFRMLSESQAARGGALSGSLLDGDGEGFHPEQAVPLDHCRVAPFGYQLGQQLVHNQDGAPQSPASGVKPHIRSSVFMRPNRKSISENIPSHEELMAIKHKKKLLASGTEHFNSRPSKGIEFLQEHGLLSDPLDPNEVALFLRDNSQLDKKKIGEYIANRKNLKVLDAFVKSFNFINTRIDEALRMYLETFRLPGEAPLISLLLEHFAEHWHKSMKEPFANSDAAFTLAYAVIMLNMDQHNHNVKKQNIPMTVEDFKKNLNGVNGGNDFDKDMLEEIYNAIKNEEIVMPAEQTGLVRENYLWKVLLRRGAGKAGHFMHAPNGLLDHDLFTLVWGPTVAALASVLDRVPCESLVLQRALGGYRKCAMVAAHYAMSDVFDNLVISLCKFTALSTAESPETVPVVLGNSQKAQLVAKMVFGLAQRHGHILRDGWKNLVDCLLQLYKAKLLPRPLVTAEDFVDPSGEVSLVRAEEGQNSGLSQQQQNIFSSFYSYLTESSQRGPNPEDERAREAALACVTNCQPELLVSESKFLREDALQELVKALIYTCHGPESHSSMSGGYDEHSTVFLLELLIKVVLQNKDRVGPIWTAVRDHLYTLVMGASASDYRFLLERAVVGILRLAIRLIRREEMTSQVLGSLQLLLLLRPATLQQVCGQVACALQELLRTSATCVQAPSDWATLFVLMACVGAGLKPQTAQALHRPPAFHRSMTSVADSTAVSAGAQSDSELSRSAHGRQEGPVDRGYTSDSELYQHQSANADAGRAAVSQDDSPRGALDSSAGGWILVSGGGAEEERSHSAAPVNQFSISLACELLPHDPFALAKCCECLAFLVRDLAHITPNNLHGCIQCIRVFVEASLHGGHNWAKKNAKPRETKRISKVQARRREEALHRRSQQHSLGYEADDEDRLEGAPSEYQHVSLQLLDLMHTLHTRAASILQPGDLVPELVLSSTGLPVSGDLSRLARGSQQPTLWNLCWCPLLQGIARLCCDTRRQIRTSALTYLQRALLVHDLQALSATEWEACFNKVLFPLLSKLMENVSPDDPVGMEETRMRGATLLCKVFLQHLNPLLSLPTFTALWLTILDFMDKYMHAEDSDLLSEAIPESLKNMLLVMDTAGVFQAAGEELENSSTGYTQLWTVTWDRIDSFLPRLKEEVFKPPPRPPTPPILPPAVTSEDAVLESNCSVDQAIRTTQEEDSYELVSVTVEEPGFVERRPSSVSIGSEGSSITLGPSQAGLASSVAFPDIPAGPVAAPVAPVPPSHSVILHPPSLSPPPVLPTAVPQIATPVPLVIDPIVFCEQHHSVFTPSQNPVKSADR